ncbi:MAG: glycosyl hydrolase family 65 protein, partial [Fusobacteriota bacterium]
MKIRDGLKTETGWEILETKYDKEQAITSGSNFMIGNGYLGYRGTFAEDTKDEYVGCIVTDTWDKADGKWEELSTVPNALFTKIFIDDQEFKMDEKNKKYYRKLDLKHGINTRYVKKKMKNGAILELNEEKFASYAKKNLVAMKYKFTLDKDSKIRLITGIDGEVWSINGEHLKNHKTYDRSGSLGIEAKTVTYEDKVNILEDFRIDVDHDYEVNYIKKEKKYLREIIFDVKADEKIEIEKFMIVYSSNDLENPKEEAFDLLDGVISYNKEKELSKKVWDEMWTDYDIEIKGNIVDQVALRFNLYHGIIATPTHKSLPIGARGLSCQAYQGAAFWDQEIYNMPMFLYSKPEIAKKILKYRYDTLDGARRKAKKLGYEGAYYAWISGKTGDELCPDFFFKDVLTGRPIRNHFNDWQIHISPDIAYAIKKYYDVTSDWEFIEDYGAEVIFEITRFLASKVSYKPMRDRYEIIRVQGPDEYHENVDNNAFTNYQTKKTLDIALDLLEKLDKKKLEELKNKINLSKKEIELWNDIDQKLYIPELNENKILEQFDGYFDLETIIPANKITERLQDEEEYYGWPNGIAVFTQCIKQADVIQLFCLYPNIFKKEVVKANYEYYEPRTLHFSSLSPSSYSIVASNIGKTEEAYKNFKKSINVDLLNTNEAVSGGTFIGGIHTAACGAAWQMVVNGFSGFSFTDDIIYFDPKLPDGWKSISFSLNIRGSKIKVDIFKDIIKLKTDKKLQGLS